MPYVEFSTVDDLPGGNLIPDGTYTAQVDGIEERRTRSKYVLWRVCLRIVGGGHPEGSANGRCVFDNWAFSPRALPRLKRIAACFGIDIRSDREISPRDFMGREVEVDVRARRYDLDGEEREENCVPYGGYRRAAKMRRQGDPPERAPGAPRRDETRPRREPNRSPHEANRPPHEANRSMAREEEAPF